MGWSTGERAILVDLNHRAQSVVRSKPYMLLHFQNSLVAKWGGGQYRSEGYLVRSKPLSVIDCEI